MQCRGVTTKRVRCRLNAVGTDCYCKLHTFDGIPMTQNASGFPPSRCIVNWVSLDPERDVRTAVVSKLRPVCFLRLTVTLLNHRELAEQNPVLVDQCLEHMSKYPHLVQYREYFARKLLKSYKEEARKKLISFYFKRCEDLCDDMIWEVLQRV